MGTLLQDLRHGIRLMLRAPAFSAAAMATLALGIGANTAIFSVVNGVLARPLPYPKGDELVSTWGRFLPESGYEFQYFSISEPEYLDYRRQTRAMEDVAAYQWEQANLSSDGVEPVRIRTVAATSNLFSILRVAPAHGRVFSEEESRPGAGCVTVLSRTLFESAFAADVAIVGRDVHLEGAPCRVLGVMPEGFAFPEPEILAWTPLRSDPTHPRDRESHGLAVLSRLRAGTSLERARAEMTALMAAWARDVPHHARGHFLILQPLAEDLVGDIRPSLLVLMGAVVLVLLIACANISNLLLARGEMRQRELAIRVALGAGRLRLVLQLVSEGVLLAAVGGALGVLAAAWSLDALLALYPDGLPRVDSVRIDGVVLAFSFALALAAGLVASLAPALRQSTHRPQDALRSEARTLTGSARAARFRQFLVVTELALSLALVVGAALLARSFHHLQQTRPGFDHDDVLTATMSLSDAAYPEPAQARRFYRELLSRVRALPGVETAGAISSLPLASGAPPDDFLIEGRPEPEPGAATGSIPNADFVMVTPGLLEALRIPLVRGRLLEAGDDRETTWVAVINETSARRFWPDDEPVGKRIRYYRSRTARGPWITIVGVVGDVRSRLVSEPARPAIYVPHAQSPREESYPGRAMSLVARSASDPSSLAPALRDVIRELDPRLPVTQVAPMSNVILSSTGRPRFTTLLVGLFAASALALSLIGLYGVISFLSRRRTHEIGVRIALGAGTGDVVRMILGESLRMVAPGLAAGVAAALVLSRTLEGLLYGVSPADPLTFIATTAVLGSVALLAVYLPARRASHTPPVEALRYE